MHTLDNFGKTVASRGAGFATLSSGVTDLAKKMDILLSELQFQLLLNCRLEDYDSELDVVVRLRFLCICSQLVLPWWCAGESNVRRRGS